MEKILITYEKINENLDKLYLKTSNSKADL